jgi:uncharacterized membrane protein YjjP (DUF1212 family)
MVDYLEHSHRMGRIKEAEEAGQVADSMEVRLQIVARIKAGEISLQEGQAELRRIQRQAATRGQSTRSQIYSGHA